MLTEEALILIATLVATGLLVLGVLDLVWPAAPRVPERPARVAPRPRSAFESLLLPREEPPAAPLASAPPPPTAPPAPAPPVTPPFTGEARATPGQPPRASADDAGTSEDVVEGADTAAASVALEPPPAPAAAHTTPPDTDAPAATPARRERTHMLPIDTCVEMFEHRRYAEVVSLGSAALEVHARLSPVSDRPDEAAALAALVGRAREQLGDRDGARAAYVAALRIARPSHRSTHVASLAALADAAAGAVPGADTEIDAGATSAQVRELLESAASVDEALRIVPGDASLARTREAVREALAVACERLVSRLADGGAEARELVLRALADESMPSAWRQRVGEQLTPISSAEIGQLTAQAIRCVQEGRDADALAALERAERLFAALPAGTVAPERLEEFERRLWWGYTKLGLSRMETGRFEESVEPLLHALDLGGIDDERLAETRAALVSALDALVEDAGRRARGPQPADVAGLAALLRRTIERGVNESDLADTLAKLEALGPTGA